MFLKISEFRVQGLKSLGWVVQYKRASVACMGLKWSRLVGDRSPSPPSFDLICLIRTLIQTELKPVPLAGLARGFLLLVACDGRAVTPQASWCF